MAGNLSGFNANDHEPGRDFDVLPNGKYLAQIVDSEQRDIGNSGSSGWKFTYTWKIMSGPHEGRLVWQDILAGYNVQGEKGDKTRSIAASQQGDICRACNKLTPDDTSDLHFIPCEITVGLQKQQNDQSGNPYPARNEVKSVKAAGANSGRDAPPAQQSRFQGAQNTNRQDPPPQQQQRSSGAPSGGGWSRPAR